MNDNEMMDTGFNERLLLACGREAVDRPPVWLMRQAGRCMPDYRELRKKHSFQKLVTTPELAAEVTALPVEKLGVDAAILFSDLLTPAACAGFKVEYREGGPFVKNPVADERDIEKIASADLVKSASFAAETVRILRGKLTVPLIGFAGAPFTTASYLVEGGPSRHFGKLKTLIYENPAFAWNLFDALAGLSTRFLEMLVDAGAQAVMIFDTWAGALSAVDFGAFELPWLQRMAMELKRKEVPVIVYINGVGAILEALGGCGADVVGVDWRIDIAEARKRLGSGVAVQGNLDPTILLGPDEIIVTRTQEMLEAAGRAPGYIFNLGHGILPEASCRHGQKLHPPVRASAERLLFS